MRSDGASSGLRGLLSDASGTSNILALSERDGAPAPVETIGLGDRYLTVRLLQFHHPVARRGFTKQFPVVFSRAAWRRPQDADLPQERVISPSLDHKAGRKGSPLAFRGQTLFGPMVYNGAVKLELGMYLQRNSKLARSALDLLVKGAQVAGMGGAVIVDTAAELAQAALAGLLPEGESGFLLGLASELPGRKGEMTGALQTGCWAVLPPNLKINSGDVRLEPISNKLIHANGKPVDAPYLVYSVEAQSHNPDRGRIPEIEGAWEKVKHVLSDAGAVDETLLQNAFQRYTLEVTLSEKLTEADKRDLIEAAQDQLEKCRRALGGDRLQATPPADLSEVDRTFAPPAADAATNAEFGKAASAQFSDAIARANAVESDSVVDNFAALSESLSSALQNLILAAGRDPEAIGKQWVDAAEELKRARRWRQLDHFGSQLRARGAEHARIIYLNALALVELGDVDKAEALVSRALRQAFKGDDNYNASEALALRGRIWKQRFVRARDTDDADMARDALTRAVGYYEDGDRYNDKPADFFHKINILALVAAGDRRGWKVRKDIKRKKLAKHIRQTLLGVPADTLAPWDQANIAEASLYLGLESDASDALRRYIAANKSSPFALNGTRRQLVEIWEIDPDGHGDLSKRVTELAVGAMANEGSLALTLSEIRKLAALPTARQDETANLEALFEGPAGMPVRHLLRAAALGEFIGAVQRINGKPVGTGFLIPGDALHASWRGEMLFVTNDHVVSADPRMARLAVHPDEARIAFKQVDERKDYRVGEILWRSDHTRHDVAILRLETAPDIQQEPIEVARGLPPRWRGEIEAEARGHGLTPPRVFILGHPVGRDLEITVENNFLIDHEHPIATEPAPPTPVRIHYRAPTEPGSSGSPIFNSRTLELIGVHHRGDADPLPGYTPPPDADYEANQGNWIQAIRANIQLDLGGPSDGKPDSAGGDRVVASAATSAQRLESAASSEPDPDADAIFDDNRDSRPETAAPGLEASRLALPRWERQDPRPAAAWPSIEQSPDTMHLADIVCTGGPEAPFEVTEDVLRKALAFARIAPDPSFGERVLFGVRGAEPIGWEAWAEGVAWSPKLILRETDPDHVTPRCTLGVWNRSAGGFWTSPGSTVPGVEYMFGQVQAGRGPGSNVANLMPPGLYRYRVGTHANGARTRQPGAFRLVSKICTLRNYGPNLRFDLSSDWDLETDASGPVISDNIHGAMTYADPVLPKFSSAGCQVAPGTMRDGRTRPDGAWRVFRMAAGLKETPDLTIADPQQPAIVASSEDGARYTYILLTARELRIAAENMDAKDDDTRFVKLRRGSTGEDVRRLQSALGLAVDGVFGFDTQRALIRRQLEVLGRADGVLTKGEIKRLRLGEPAQAAPPEPEQAGAV